MKILIVVEGGAIQEIVYARDDDMPKHCRVTFFLRDEDLPAQGDPLYSAQLAVSEDKERVANNWRAFEVQQQPAEGGSRAAGPMFPKEAKE